MKVLRKACPFTSPAANTEVTQQEHLEKPRRSSRTCITLLDKHETEPQLERDEESLTDLGIHTVLGDQIGELSWLILHQLGWATRCPHIWSNIILDVSVRVFWLKLTSKSWTLSKADCTPNLGGPQSISWRPEGGKNKTKLAISQAEENLLTDYLWISSLTLAVPGSTADGLQTQIGTSAPLDLQPVGSP